MGKSTRSIFGSLILIFLFGCEGKFEADPLQVFSIQLVAPADSEVCNVSLLESGDLSVRFQWSTDIIFGGDFILSYTNTVTGDTQTVMVEGGVTSTTLTLAPGIRYTWNVSAISNGETLTAERDFVTVTPGLQNTTHPPYLSDITVTSQGNNSFLLDYLAIDPDNDPIRYDVYLDTSNPPIQIIETDISSNQTTTGQLNAATTYYLRVVAKDGTGNETSATRSYTTP